MSSLKIVCALLGVCVFLQVRAQQVLGTNDVVRSELQRLLEVTSDDRYEGPTPAQRGSLTNLWWTFFAPASYSGLSLTERKVAYESYLSSMCTNDFQRMDGEEVALFRVALYQCEIVSYTNAVPMLKQLVLNQHGIAKNHALRMIVEYSPPTDVLTDFIESVMTNKVSYRREDRGAACRTYADKVRLWVPQNPGQNRIKQRATGMFYRNRMIDAVGAYSLDRLFIGQYPGYEFSSNRLEYIGFVLTHPLFREVPYYNAITNQLLMSNEPLRQLTIGEGGNE